MTEHSHPKNTAYNRNKFRFLFRLNSCYTSGSKQSIILARRKHWRHTSRASPTQVHNHQQMFFSFQKTFPRTPSAKPMLITQNGTDTTDQIEYFSRGWDIGTPNIRQINNSAFFGPAPAAAALSRKSSSLEVIKYLFSGLIRLIRSIRVTKWVAKKKKKHRTNGW